MSIWKSLFGSNGSSTTVADIPEEVFIEKTEPAPQPEAKAADDAIRQDNIQALYDFLSKDFQQLGYDDALVTPDTHYRDQNIQAILGDLDILTRRVKTFYEDAIRELDFLIDTRSRLGMVDVVDELKMKKSKAEDHYQKTVEIQKEAQAQGNSHRLIISYNRGFNNGMAAIAHHESNKRKF